MKKRIRWSFASAAMMILGCDSNTAGSEGGDSGEKNRNSDPIVIGVINPITGPVSQAGLRVESDLVLAQQEINEAGGILGRPLKYIHRDSHADAEKAADAARDLIENEGVEVIYGAVISGVTNGVLDVTVPAEVMVVNGFSSSVSLTQRDNDGLFVRTTTTTELETRVLAQVAQAAGHSKIGIIASESDYTNGLATGFKEAFEAMDCGSAKCEANILSYPEDQDPDSTIHLSHLEEALEDEPDALYLCAYAENGTAYLQAGTSAAYTGTWYVPSPLRHEEVLLLLDQATVDQLEGVESADRVGEIGYDKYHAAFMKVWDERTGSGGVVYDAIMLAALAATHAGEWKARSIADSIREISQGGGTKIWPTEYAKGVSALESDEAIDFDGATSNLDIDSKGDVFGKKFDFWKMQNGKKVVVDTIEPAAGSDL